MGTGSGTSLFDGGRAAWQMGTCKKTFLAALCAMILSMILGNGAGSCLVHSS